MPPSSAFLTWKVLKWVTSHRKIGSIRKQPAPHPLNHPHPRRTPSTQPLYPPCYPMSPLYPPHIPTPPSPPTHPSARTSPPLPTILIKWELPQLYGPILQMGTSKITQSWNSNKDYFLKTILYRETCRMSMRPTDTEKKHIELGSVSFWDFQKRFPKRSCLTFQFQSRSLCANKLQRSKLEMHFMLLPFRPICNKTGSGL